MPTFNFYFAAASGAQPPSTVINMNNTIAPTATNNPAAKNTTKQTLQAWEPDKADRCEQAFRQALDRVARKQLDIDKAGDSEKSKQKEKNLASYSDQELKLETEELENKLEEMRKEMKHRGIR
ncbi:hypothetical protein E4T52_15220 [Aureobasidium sp. EXF-3400]|nr:hypothetical protein E4T51_14262 [Aureobasidium sp. EXF-12344]KAI4769736.1 hypothetical protein E4T52_15220 [Aureobasidium sp. EXF-3400]